MHDLHIQNSSQNGNGSELLISKRIKLEPQAQLDDNIETMSQQSCESSTRTAFALVQNGDASSLLNNFSNPLTPISKVSGNSNWVSQLTENKIFKKKKEE